MSDKLGRRCIQFYDLYKLEKPANEVDKLKDRCYPIEGILQGQVHDEKTGQVVLDLNGEDEPLFGDIEIDDFNKLFRNQHFIRDRYG